MNPSEWCVIVNPNASSVDSIQDIEKALGRLGAYRLIETSKPGEGLEAAKAATEAGVRRVVAVGGDGTLNEVINGIADRLSDVTVGLIPLGTGNDFANSLGIEPGFEQAIDLLNQGFTRSVDVIRLTNRELSRLFVNTSAGGFTTIINEKLTPESKDWLGALAFYVAGARALPELTTYRMKIKFDQEEVVEADAYNIVVANGRTIAGGIPVAPAARLDDGLMDVMIIPAVSIAKLALLLPLILAGRHADSQDLIARQARTFRVSSSPNFGLNTDGEAIGEAPALYDVLPGALRVIAKPD